MQKVSCGKCGCSYGVYDVDRHVECFSVPCDRCNNTLVYIRSNHEFVDVDRITHSKFTEGEQVSVMSYRDYWYNFIIGFFKA